MGLNLIEGRQSPKESTNQDHRPSKSGFWRGELKRTPQACLPCFPGSENAKANTEGHVHRHT